jgi:hypothetical protein
MELVQDYEGGKLHVQHCHYGEGDQETTCDMHGLWTFLSRGLSKFFSMQKFLVTCTKKVCGCNVFYV